MIEDIWRKAILLNDSTISQAIENLDKTAAKIVVVVNQIGMLEGTISDGDIRRGLLKGYGMSSSVTSVMNRNPLVLTIDVKQELVKQLMIANKIHQIPVVDTDYRVVGLHLWDEFTATMNRPNVMLIMAGGRGKRMGAHTDKCPKPLLNVAGKPMLAHIIDRAKLEGFNRFVIAIHYLGHMIESYFGNGSFLGVQINYLREDSPLGTAGALGLIDPQPEVPFIVTNGDVITNIQYNRLLDFHIRHSATATMAVRAHEWRHPFGVVQTQGVDIISLDEKPIARNHINAGVYVLNPAALVCLEKNVQCDMPTLFERLKDTGHRTVAYPMHEEWMDVGRPDDLVTANQK